MEVIWPTSFLTKNSCSSMTAAFLARARSWLFVHSIRYHTKGRKSRIAIKPLAPFLVKHELKKGDEYKIQSVFFFSQIMQNHFQEPS